MDPHSKHVGPAGWRSRTVPNDAFDATSPILAYTITEIAELVEYHLIASAPDAAAAHNNLVRQLELLAPRLLRRDATWVFCDRCGTSVDTYIIHPDGHHYTNKGEFYCADCWELLQT